MICLQPVCSSSSSSPSHFPLDTSRLTTGVERHRPNRGRSSRGHSLCQDISPPSPARVPPTPPPQRPDSRFHDRRESYPRSPSASVSRGSVSSTTTSASAPSHDLYVHPHHQSRILSSPSSTTASSGPSPPYASPALSTASYTSPVESSASGSMYFYQAAQPKQAPTTTTAIPPAPAVVPVTTSTWPQQQQQQQQHHHYFPPSTAAPYQQPQDRYICRVCNKAFSRPSSLRIHSHSHTGEKPFRCTHAGCGKSFSVRSNMKRHERGCHPARSLV